MTVGGKVGERIIADVGDNIKTGEFGERRELGVVKALHEQSLTWLTGNGVDEQHQSKQQNPLQIHVVSGLYTHDRKRLLNEIKWESTVCHLHGVTSGLQNVNGLMYQESNNEV